MAFERGLHDSALHPAAAAVDESHVAQAGGSGGVDVLLHDRRDISRGEGMQVELALDRDMHRVVGHSLG